MQANFCFLQKLDQSPRSIFFYFFKDAKSYDVWLSIHYLISRHPKSTENLPPSCAKKNNNKQREFWTETLNVVCKSLIAWFDCLFTRELHLQLFVGILDLSLKVLLTFCQYFHGLLNIWLHICQYRQIHLLTIQLLCILVECTIFHEKEICYFMSKRHTRKSPKFVNKAKLLLEVMFFIIIFTYLK